MTPLGPGSPSGGLTLSMSVSAQVTDGQGGNTFSQQWVETKGRSVSGSYTFYFQKMFDIIVDYNFLLGL